MCGIVGVVAKNAVNQLLYDGLLVLQHRGQDAAGIVTADGANFRSHKGPGMVRDVFRTRNMRALAGFLGVFVAVLLAMSVLAIVASKLVKSAGLGLEDRLLGGVFGLARGLLVVTVIVLLAGLTALPRQAVWRNAILSGPLVAFAGMIKAWLPAELAQRITYD